MEYLFLLLWLVSVIGFIVGMFIPKKTLFWDPNSSRKKVAIYTVILFLVSTTGIGIFAEPNEAQNETALIPVSDQKQGENSEIDSKNNTEKSAEKNSGKDLEQAKSMPVSSNFTETAQKNVSGTMYAHFIDVGQGDATLLIGPDFTILIDAGRHDKSDVVHYLRNVGVSKIDLLIGTHPHADHIGQMDKVLNAFTVTEVWMSGDPHTSKTFERTIDAILSKGADYHEPRRGETHQIGSLVIEVLNPGRLTGNLHEGSISIRALYGKVGLIFTGDAEEVTEREIISSGMSLNAQIFQLGHHGSRTSNSSEFLRAINPKIAIYSAAQGNSYGHPHDEVVSRIKNMGIEIYGTDIHGTIIIETNGEKYSVKTSKSSASSVVAKPPQDRAPLTTQQPQTPVSVPTQNPEPSKTEPNIVSGQSSVEGRVNVNTASLEELKKIIHINDVRGRDLISKRPFKSIDDLERITGIADKRVKEIKEQGIAYVE